MKQHYLLKYFLVRSIRVRLYYQRQASACEKSISVIMLSPP